MRICLTAVCLDFVQGVGADSQGVMSKRTARMMEEGSSSRHNISGGSQRSSPESTRSLRSEDLSVVNENGRAYPNDTFFMPCDSQEQTRLSILHRVFLNALGGQLTTAPLPSTIERILDVGSGSGDWAVAIALEYPGAEVVAVDLAVWDVEAAEEDAKQRLDEQGMHDVELPEVTWEIADLDMWGPVEHVEVTVEEGIEDEHVAKSVTGLNTQEGGKGRANSVQSNRSSRRESWRRSYNPPSRRGSVNLGWNFSEPFDFIHIRGMKGAFAYWTGVYRECYANLVPGGWLEVVDFQYHIAQPDSVMREVFINFHAVASKSGYPVTTTHLQREFFEAAGFEEYEMIAIDIPLGAWPGDDENHTLGKMHLVSLVESIEATALRSMTKHAGFTKEEVQERCGDVVQELLTGVHDQLETSFRFVRARKPLNDDK
ncbi:S-adenosyl-L-methionine-dependent methyltransferase [Pseudovirgaria hyperparasitica]|uniref:S-adenosyl-L-methionine-dependent methyltransferase n=1 Tax=Pseudovirgaria hyperparasitica TaxID=470096 RepID=A0A6A6W2C0_9PEZI|nr:S-adenosyl-L-methionine-dependent methyltransferase [Pseudovirgaria hyperparasitica]KAF2756164.1 S-adenosyl-L-methionine-dependent methyltransferase [Pseudovirgaria hyperparasitica]